MGKFSDWLDAKDIKPTWTGSIIGKWVIMIERRMIIIVPIACLLLLIIVIIASQGTVKP